MADTVGKSTDKLALALCLGGVLIAVAVAIVGRLFGQNFTMMAYGIFVAFQIAALVLGMVARSKPLGKTAAITSGVLLVASVLFIS